MAVPPQEVFTQWLDAARKPVPMSPEAEHALYGGDLASMSRDAIREQARAPFTREQALLVFREQYETRVASWRALCTHPLFQWLSSQREFKRAQNLVMFGRKTPKAEAETTESDDDYIARRVDAMFEKAGDGFPGSFAWRVLDMRARNTFERGWVYETVAALREYYYSDAWATCLLLSKSYDTTIKHAQDALRLALAAIKELEALAISQAPRQADVGRVSRALETVGRWQIPARSFPIHRKDPHARERLFVFRMVKANRREARRSKSDAIVELMGLEDFAHQYDARTVERICREFTGKFNVIKT